jgi:hypothetical protein
VSALFSGPSFSAAFGKICISVWIALISIRAAFNRGTFLPHIDFGITIRYLRLALCLTHCGPSF